MDGNFPKETVDPGAVCSHLLPLALSATATHVMTVSLKRNWWRTGAWGQIRQLLQIPEAPHLQNFAHDPLNLLTSEYTVGIVSPCPP